MSQPTFLLRIERVFSKTRFDSYKNGESAKIALARHMWNTALCECLYPLFQILEVGFRNSVHYEISKHAKDDRWLANELGILRTDELNAVKLVKKNLLERAKPISEDFLVAELSFGFWTSLLDAHYETMWHKIIGGVFPEMPRTLRTRREASKLMNQARRLRNAALHHHSIWHWRDLEKQHSDLQLLISYICPSLSAIGKKTDRFPVIYSGGHLQFENLADELTSI